MEWSAIQALQLGCKCRSFGLFQQNLAFDDHGTSFWRPHGVKSDLERRFGGPGNSKLALEWRFEWRAGAKLALERHTLMAPSWPWTDVLGA